MTTAATAAVKDLGKQLAVEEREEKSAVMEAHVARAALAEAKSTYDTKKARLVEIARIRREPGRASVELAGEEQIRVRVSFGSTISYDARLLDRLKKAIGARRFAPLFRTEIAYKATAKLRDFLKAEGNDAAKKLIVAGQIVKDKAPDVRWSGDEDADPGEES